MKQYLLTAVIAAAVAGGVSYAMRPVADTRQATRLQLLETRVFRIAKIVGLVFGEGD